MPSSEDSDKRISRQTSKFNLQLELERSSSHRRSVVVQDETLGSAAEGEEREERHDRDKTDRRSERSAHHCVKPAK